MAVALIAALGNLGGCAEEANEPAVVEMTDKLTFSPETLTIQAGGRVKWVNVSLVRHTVTADPAKAADPAHVKLPEGAKAFDSGYIDAEASYTRTFTTPGRFVYFCIPHEGAGMIGTVVVEE